MSHFSEDYSFSSLPLNSRNLLDDFDVARLEERIARFPSDKWSVGVGKRLFAILEPTCRHTFTDMVIAFVRTQADRTLTAMLCLDSAGQEVGTCFALRKKQRVEVGTLEDMKDLGLEEHCLSILKKFENERPAGPDEENE